jgi:hypothetical protein
LDGDSVALLPFLTWALPLLPVVLSTIRFRWVVIVMVWQRWRPQTNKPQSIDDPDVGAWNGAACERVETGVLWATGVGEVILDEEARLPKATGLEG